MNIFSFKGRARRTEFWLVNLPISIFWRISDQLFPDESFDSLEVSIGVIALVIVLLWLSIATNTRRCHDLGHNGFWQLIPFYGFWMAFAKGDDNTNEYGSKPGEETL